MIWMICACSQAQCKSHLLIISIDGMRPDYVTQADKHGLKIPTLRKFLAEGTYAEGVNGVLPSLTYPSHTSLITGTWPAEHGVYGNSKFNTKTGERGGQITDISTIKVPTLWQAAHEAGYTVSNVGWPVTTGAKFIDWLLPANAAFEKKTDFNSDSNSVGDDSSVDNPPGLGKELAKEFPKDNKFEVNERRHEWQMLIIKKFKPEFMTAHMGLLDHQEHVHGPFSPQANAAIESLDAWVAELIAAEKEVYPDAYIMIVSDHGFLPTERVMSVNALFAKEGLLNLEAKTWEAKGYDTGGTCAVVLRDPSNQEMIKKVRSVLEKAARNPEYGIGKILEHDEIVARGGMPEATFMLDAAAGWHFFNDYKQIVKQSKGTGAHGQLLDHPELRSSFMLMGPGVASGKNVGVIDMRQIAPTAAQILGINFPSARMAPIQFKAE